VIIATAGHVDHGKTSLVRILTGIDTDRLAEEKLRGLSIELGFAYWPLSNGQTVGFIDVPGHQHFIRNMLAGVSAIDAALLVVAADDGLMPQTYQHLAILDLMGVERGFVALTKTDLVTPERLSNVKKMVAKCLFGTTLAHAPIIPTSIPHGEGINKLGAEIEQLSQNTHPRALNGLFRMTIDRAFNVHGTGTVVTGTISSGVVRSGSRLKLIPNGQSVRVRSVRAHNKNIEKGIAGQRVGLNISGLGIKSSQIGLGHWLVASDLYAPTTCLDTSIHLLDTEKKPLEVWTKVHLHIGTAQTTARLGLIDRKRLKPGETSFARLVSDCPLSALYGDRFILQDNSASRILAGGRVINPFAIQNSRLQQQRVNFLESLDCPNSLDALSALLENSPNGIDFASFALARNLDKADITRILSEISIQLISSKNNEIAFKITDWLDHKKLAVKALKDLGKLSTLKQGLTHDGLKRATGYIFSSRTITALVDELVQDGEINFDGQSIQIHSNKQMFSREEQKLSEHIIKSLEMSPLAPPALGTLANNLEVDGKYLLTVLRRMEIKSIIVSVTNDRHFLSKTMQTFTKIILASASNLGGQISLVQFRHLTGLNRNRAIEVLEYFDKIGLTRRNGHSRIIHHCRFKTLLLEKD